MNIYKIIYFLLSTSVIVATVFSRFSFVTKAIIVIFLIVAARRFLS